jgi:hypothetical protein
LAGYALVAALTAAACSGGPPGADGLRDAFAAQLAANSFVSNVQRDGDEITFAGPAGAGGSASWRVVVRSAVVESNGDPALPYKGTVTSSWYSDGQPVIPLGRESNLPLELTSNGLAQECWALWNDAVARWEWE